MSEDELRAGTLELLCYLMTAARGVIYEPRLYAPFRLAEGARRLILLMEAAGVTDPEWHAISEEIHRNVMPAITDEETCQAILDDLVLRLTDQLKEL